MQTNRTSKNKREELSIMRGRSICPHCKHQLAVADLIPVISWLFLRGKCRYCHKPISSQYPLVELLMAVIFAASFTFWPYALGSTLSYIAFCTWLVCATCLVILAIYDMKWLLLPDRVLLILTPFAVLTWLLVSYPIGFSVQVIRDVATSLVLLAGLFAALYAVSKGKWIGFGDVKLGVALGFLAMNPSNALLLLFLSSLLGTIAILPGLLTGKLKKSSQIPFGPFLILACFIVFLWGVDITTWAQTILLFTDTTP